MLREEPLSDWQAPLERVRRALRTQTPPPRRETPVWGRKVSVPLPVAALAAALVLIFGAALAVTQLRPHVGLVRITKAPAGRHGDTDFRSHLGAGDAAEVRRG